jgi:hypothetical protein
MWCINFNYYRTQQLYTASELNFAGTIRAIGFWASGTPPDTLNNSSQWLADVPDTVFSDIDWDSTGKSVWTGNLIVNDTGWVILPLTRTFTHSRDRSLLVSYSDAGTRESLYLQYRTTVVPELRSKWGWSDWDTAPGMNQQYHRANILIVYTPSAPDSDAQTLNIVAPQGTVNRGQACTPRAVVRNNGTDPATFPVRFDIAGGYQATRTESALASGASDTINFPQWLPDSGGAFTVRCSTELNGDQSPGNDRMTDSVFVQVLDAEAVAIQSPADTVDSGVPVSPQVEVRNNGNTPISFRTWFEIAGGYADTQNVTGLAPESGQTVTFAPWKESSRSTLAMKCSTMLSGDMADTNDWQTGSVNVRVCDVGVTRVTSPPESLPQGDSATPGIMVANWGSTIENVPVCFVISIGSSPVYAESTSIQLSPGESATTVFPIWRTDSAGEYSIAAFTRLTGDQHPANDTAQAMVTVWRPGIHDVAVTAIVAPAGILDTGNSLIPAAKISNQGDGPETFLAQFTVTDSSGVRDYKQTLAVASLGPGQDTVLFFPALGLHVIGSFTARCSASVAGDCNRSNDTISVRFQVQNPPPWHRMSDIPVRMSDDYVMAGGALAGVGDTIFALKGNRTREFYAYSVLKDTWVSDCSLSGDCGAFRGGAMCVGPDSHLYAVKGGNRDEFWTCSPGADSWQRLPDVPEARPGWAVRDGACLTAESDDRIYLLKGGRTCEFYCYIPAQMAWQRLKDAPCGLTLRGYPGGSSMAAVRDYLYLVKGNTSEMFAYSTIEDTWYLRSAMPGYGRTHRKRMARSGTSVVAVGDGLYVLKGGASELWYDTVGDTWRQMEDLPFGDIHRTVGPGGAMTLAGNRLWALKGNHTGEFWSYVLPQSRLPLAAYRLPLAAHRQSAVCNLQSVIINRPALAPLAAFSLRVAPNPSFGDPVITYSLPGPCAATVKLLDAEGRVCRTFEVDDAVSGQQELALKPSLPEGAYFVRLEIPTGSLTSKLVVRK